MDNLSVDRAIDDVNETLDIDTSLHTGGISNLTDMTKITEEMFNKEAEIIKTLNYTESVHYKKEIKDQIKSFVSLKDIVTELIDLQKSNGILDFGAFGDKVALANLETEAKIPVEEMQDFLDNYDESFSLLIKTEELIMEHLDTFKNVKKSLTFINNECIHTLQKRLETLMNDKHDISHNKNAIIITKNLIEIYSNAESVDYILDKISQKKIELKNLYKQITSKKTNPSFLKNVQTNVSNELTQVFTLEMLKEFEKYLDDVITDKKSEYDIFLINYALYLIRKDSTKYRRYKWVDCVILNVLAINKGVYDLPGGVELYNKQLNILHKNILNIVMN